MSSTNSGNYIISTTNKDGVRIVLETETYNNHILIRHPEMKDNISAIQDNIENPMYIVQSHKEPKNKLYITKSTKATYPNLYLKTVVNTINPRMGYIRTTHFEKDLDISKEGTIIYEKKN